MLVGCMLTNVRRNAGLGDPPQPYYNNIPESANALIKRSVGFKESEVSEFCKSMSKLAMQQKEDVDSAIFNTVPANWLIKLNHFKVDGVDGVE